MVAEVEAAPTASPPHLLPHLITGIYSLIFLGPMVGPFGGASTFFDDLCLPIRLLSLFEIGGSRPRSTHIAYASAYHQEQRPHVLLSAARFQMNDYFGHIHGSTVPSLSCSALDACWSFNTLLTWRARSMVKQLGMRDDFKVEKEKCVMMNFLSANNISHPRVVGTWYDQAAFNRTVDALPLMDTPWPLFIKACHLTTGGAQSVQMWKSSAWVKEHREEIEKWTQAKRAYDEHDGRQWREYHKAMVSTLTPGFLLQEPANVSFDPFRANQPLEFKTEVLWGRAILASWRGNGKLLVSRAPETNPGAGIRFEAFSDDLLLTPVAPDSYWNYLRDERHFELCIWPIAEALARAGGFDEVRVDIFVGPRGAPHLCQVNEISLTSGSKYGMHAMFLANLWGEVGARVACAWRVQLRPAEGVRAERVHRAGVRGVQIKIKEIQASSHRYV